MPVDSVAFRARRVPPVVRGLIALPVVAACAYFLVTQSGPYAWVANLQMRYLGAYYPVLSGLFVVAVCLLPAALLVQVLASIWPRAATEPSPDQQREIAAREEETVRRYVWPAILLLGAAAALSIAAVQLTRAATLGSNEAYTLSEDAWPRPRAGSR